MQSRSVDNSAEASLQATSYKLPASILHLDADAFFASVEQVKNPKLKNKPVIIAGSHRSVVSSASYEARRFGIHSAMPTYKAKKLCPHGIFLEGNHHLYSEFSRQMFKIFRSFTPDVEPISIDEAYFDLNGLELLYQASPKEITRRLLLKVHQTLGLTLSGGLSTNKTVSKIASSLNKPRKLTIIPAGKEKSFLAPLPLRYLPGVGEKTLPLLQKLNLHTIGDLAAMPFKTLVKYLGIHGFTLWERAQGLDDRSIQTESSPPKSISKEHTFRFDLNDFSRVYHTLKQLLGTVLYRLRQTDFYARTLFLKIRYADFSTFTFRRTLPVASNLEKDFLEITRELLETKWPRYLKIRLIGVGVTNFISNRQLSLFDASFEKSITLTRHLDSLRAKYGLEVINYGFT